MKALQVIVSLFCVVGLVACDRSPEIVVGVRKSPVSTELKKFVEVLKGNLISVEGGSFLMGDYGAEYCFEHLPYDSDVDSKPFHDVLLSSYSIGEFKITNRAFNLYLKANGLELRHDISGGMFEVYSVPPNVPAHMDWYEAEKYCKWLADISELPFALPTEAQWEYAATSRGQFMMVATDDGTYRVTRERIPGEQGLRGLNISSTWNRQAFAKEMGWRSEGLTPLPVDQFPPNPLGLYSMSDNGLEWLNDWYDPDYYKHSPLKDPKGPDEPVFKDYFGRDTKVVRGQSLANPAWGGGINVHRTAAEPHGFASADKSVFLSSKTARCVVNSPEPVS